MKSALALAGIALCLGARAGDLEEARDRQDRPALERALADLRRQAEGRGRSPRIP